MAKITRTCDKCGRLIRKPETWELIKDPKFKKLCPDCWWIVIDINNPKGEINDKQM